MYDTCILMRAQPRMPTVGAEGCGPQNNDGDGSVSISFKGFRDGRLSEVNQCLFGLFILGTM